jgi:hypothetical protein
MLKTCQQAFFSTMRQWRIAAIVYFVQLSLALTLGMQAHSVLESSIGHSLEINKLLAQYDHTVLTDFLKVHGASITPLIGQLRWLLLVWLVFSVFINAGLLFSAVSASSSDKIATRSFWQAGAAYFFPFLKISLLYLLLALAWTVIIFLPILLSLEPLLAYFRTEQYTVWLTLLLLLIYLIGLAMLFMASVLSRIEYLKTGASIASSVKNGWRIFWNNKRGFWDLISIFAAFQIVLWAVYWFLEAAIGMTSPGGILFLFGMQQCFMFFRIQIRQMMYAGASQLSLQQ